MGFHEVRLSERISYGSRGGPGFDTNIIETGGGQEQTVARRSEARHTYNIAYGVKSQEDMSDLKIFYMARLGVANGFRYKDWADFTSTTRGFYYADESSDISDTDQIIGTGDGTTVQFQLVKNYTSGGVTRIRRIVRPVSGTTVIAKNGSPMASGWSVNITTGIVTFDTAPDEGDEITAGFQFDVPVRFGKEVDDVLAMRFDDFDTGSADIPLVEILSPDPSYDEFSYGGAFELCLSTSYTVSIGQGRAYVVSTPASGKFVVLPDAETIPTGGPVFYFINLGSNSFAIKRSDLTTLITLATGEAAELILGVDNAGDPIWYAI